MSSDIHKVLPSKLPEVDPSPWSVEYDDLITPKHDLSAPEYRDPGEAMLSTESQPPMTTPGLPSDTVVKLKSFISENLSPSGGDSYESTGSSDDNLESAEISAEHNGKEAPQNEVTGRATPEPQPLTTTNVTMHDAIWSHDIQEAGLSFDGQEKCIRLLESSADEVCQK